MNTMTGTSKSQATKHWPPERLTPEEQDSLRQEMRESALMARRMLAELSKARAIKGTAV
jgi:hypothetical protein